MVLIMAMITPEKVAEYLLQEGFLLTALELQMEVTEKSGKGVQSLTEFFDDSSNFDKYVKYDKKDEDESPCATVTDISTRNSELFDDESAGKIALLEYELRKARDTINGLKRQLLSDEKRHQFNDEDEDDENIGEEEKRIINYLVNEYFLRHNYKLTSITFNEENLNQDFEDWDDNHFSDKPPSLLNIYRSFFNKKVKTSEVAVQASEDFCK